MDSYEYGLWALVIVNSVIFIAFGVSSISGVRDGGSTPAPTVDHASHHHG